MVTVVGVIFFQARKAEALKALLKGAVGQEAGSYTLEAPSTSA